MWQANAFSFRELRQRRSNLAGGAQNRLATVMIMDYHLGFICA